MGLIWPMSHAQTKHGLDQSLLPHVACQLSADRRRSGPNVTAAIKVSFSLSTLSVMIPNRLQLLYLVLDRTRPYHTPAPERSLAPSFFVIPALVGHRWILRYEPMKTQGSRWQLHKRDAASWSYRAERPTPRPQTDLDVDPLSKTRLYEDQVT